MRKLLSAGVVCLFISGCTTTVVVAKKPLSQSGCNTPGCDCPPTSLCKRSGCMDCKKCGACKTDCSPTCKACRE